MKPAAVVDSAIRVARADVGDELLARLRAALAYPNPAAGRWGEPATLSTVRLEGGDVVLPRGASALARDLGLRLIDRRLALPPRPLRLRRELRDYQAAARDEALRREQGVIVLPTGGGKTLTGLAIIAAAGQPALVVVPSLDLAEQWADAARGDLGIEPSMCIAGAVNVGDVTIAHPRTLAGEGRLEELRERFGLVLIDEAHHAPAASTRAILDALPARFRFGITATPTRTDELAPLVAHYLGPVIARRSAAELAGRGFLIRPRREEVRTGSRSRTAGRPIGTRSSRRSPWTSSVTSSSPTSSPASAEGEPWGSPSPAVSPTSPRSSPCYAPAGCGPRE